MIVTCQNCNARFNLKDSLVKPRGSKVRCSKCQYIFVVYPEAPPKSAAPGKTAPMGDAAADPAPDQGPDLSEIEKMLESSEGQGLDFGKGATDSDSESRESPAAKSGADGGPKGPDTAGGILDLSEIEKMLDLDQELDFDGESAEAEPDDLIFDLEEPMAEEADDKENLGDFDLADIEKMLEQDMQETETEAPAEAPSDSGDIDLSDLDELLITTPEAEAPEAATPAPPMEQAGAQAADELSLASESDEDLDLSALDEMMETESPAAPDSPPQPEEGDLKLEFEDEETAQGPATEAAPSEAADELDFSGLEAMMEAEGGESAPDTADEAASASTPAGVEAAGEEMDLEFEMEEPESPPAGEDSEDDLQISIDEQEGESAGAEAAGETSESDELSLEFDDEPIESAQTDEATPEEKEAAMSSPVHEPESSEDQEAEEAIEEDADEQDDAVSAEQAAAEAAGSDKRQRVYMIALLVLILVIAALGGGLFYMRQAGIQIPFLAGLQKPQVHDQGNLKITTIDIDSRRVENASAGHLFVISGKVRNGYKDARSFIRITGKLYSKGKKLFSKETVFCGNIMSDIELAKLPLETIKSRLGNKKGDNGADIGIKPGQERPFMIVFSNLPANLEELEEYTLEVASSKPAGPADGHP